MTQLLEAWGDLEALVEDVRLEIVRQLDSPSRFALALTSRSFRALLDRFTSANSTFRFNSNIFLKECAERRYRGLWEWAVEGGALVHFVDLAAAVKSNDVAIATLAFKHLFFSKIPSLMKYNLLESACKHYNPAMIRLCLRVQSDPSWTAANYGLLAGLAAAGLDDFLTEIGLPQDALDSKVTNIAADALKLGNASLAIKSYATASDSVKWAFLNAAFEVEDMDSVKLFLDPPNAPDVESFRFYLCKSLTMFKYLCDHLGGFADRWRSNSSLLPTVLEKFPTAENVKYALDEYHAEWNHHHTMMLIKNDLSNDLMGISYGEIVPRPGRWEILRYIYDRGARWSVDDLAVMPRWATREQFQWAVSKATDTIVESKKFPFIVAEFLSSVEVADPGILDLLLSKPMVWSRMKNFVLECCFVENNLEVLDFLFKKFSSGVFEPVLATKRVRDNVLHQVAVIYLRNLAMRRPPRDFLLSKLRPRFHNLAKLLEWFSFIGVSIRKDHLGSILDLFGQIKNAYFQNKLVEIRALRWSVSDPPISLKNRHSRNAIYDTRRK